MTALDLLNDVQVEIVRAQLIRTAPHLKLEDIAGDASAIYGLLAQARGNKPKNEAICSVQFPTVAH